MNPLLSFSDSDPVWVGSSAIAFLILYGVVKFSMWIWGVLFPDKPE